MQTAIQGQSNYDKEQAGAANRFTNTAISPVNIQQTPVVNPPLSTPQGNSVTSTNPGKSVVPVITAKAAEDDYAKKLATFNSLKSQVQNQKSVLAQQAAQKAADDAQKEAIDAKNKLDTTNANTAATKAAADKAVADAKLTAAKSLGQSDTTTTSSTDNSAVSTTPTQTTTDTSQTLPNSTNTLLNNEGSALSTIQDEKTSAFEDYKSQVSQILNGTFPLSSTESALVGATMASFDRQKQDQAQANKAYEGSVAESSFRNGGEYTPVQAAGQLATAISTGVQKIANLDAQAAKTVADLEQGFMKQDYEMVNNLYEKLDKQLTDKSNSIKSIFDAAMAAEKDQRNYNLDVQKFNESKDQNAFDRAYKIEQENFDENYKKATLKLERDKFDATQNPTGINTGISGAVTMTAQDTPDPVQQQALLDKISSTYGAMTAQQIKGIANYTINPADFSTRNLKGGAGMTRSQAVALAQQLDPTYDDKQYATRAAYLKNLTSGQMAQGVLAGNKAINHLVAFASSVSGLANLSPISGINAISNNISSVISPKTQQNVKTAQVESSGLKDELAKFFKGTGTSDVKSIDDWSKNLDVNASAANQKGLVQGAINLLAGQLDVMTQQYTSTLGKAPEGSILQPQTIQKLSNLKNQGYQVDIPGVYYTDKNAFMKYDTDAQSKLNDAYNNLKAAGIPTTPDNILQAAQL